MAKPTPRVSRVLMTGPLALFADAYRVELGERGYAPLSMVSELRQVARFSRWLEVDGLTVADVSEARVDEFLEWQRANWRHCHSWSRPGLRCLLDVLRGLGVLAAEQPAAGSPKDVLLAQFERYLLAERGLAAGTVVLYSACVRRFVDGLPSDRELAGLAAGDVTAAVLREAESVSVSAAQNFVSGVRWFLRFCFIEGLVGGDLSRAALLVRGRSSSPLPRGISRADARALLGSCDRRQALGRRDYAIIILLLRLGSRRGEVAGVRLDDIDWRAGELVIRGKGSRRDVLPLPADVGEAIAAYLRRGRPRSDRREVFLRSKAPYEPIASGTVASTVRRACRRAGIAEFGSHRLRHTAACEMVRANVPLYRIGQVLRHRSLQSTAIYARVDVERLRLLAAPWPGGLAR
ncbi:MAG: tyrosine-type recombinase/integrase [Acetobacteraceae bacterium]|nr:tyrosine-type recombinase/integrase [Acetobacteraceae bacterium]